MPTLESQKRLTIGDPLPRTRAHIHIYPYPYPTHPLVPLNVLHFVVKLAPPIFDNSTFVCMNPGHTRLVSPIPVCRLRTLPSGLDKKHRRTR